MSPPWVWSVMKSENWLRMAAARVLPGIAWLSAEAEDEDVLPYRYHVSWSARWRTLSYTPAYSESFARRW